VRENLPSQFSRIMRRRHDVAETQFICSGCRASRVSLNLLLAEASGSAATDNSNPRRSSQPQTSQSAVMQFPFFARFAVIKFVGAALLAAAWAEGLLLKPYRA
jgi:hypothetical protein